MPLKLRTVVDLDSRIWTAARARAFREKVSVSYLTNLALRDLLGLKVEVKPRRIGRPAKKAQSGKKTPRTQVRLD